MIRSDMTLKVLICCSFFIFYSVSCQDLAFPTDFQDGRAPIHPRFRSTSSEPVFVRRTTERPRPVVNQEKCPGNQLYYPGEPWFCDCGPKFIYHKQTDECYSVYMRGPCPEGQHLIVRNRKVQCVRNPCMEGRVRYNGKCYELEKSDGPCEEINGTTALLKINPDTLNVECTEADATILTLFNFPERCPPGSKRDKENKCRENWNVD